MVNLFKHLFIPHHTNNFRAKLLHTDFLAFYIVIFFALSITFKTIHKLNPNILGFATNIFTDQLLQLTNQKRAEFGYVPLKLDPQLSQAAAGKANDMFVNNYWAHNSPYGKTPWDFINSSGYIYNIAGENLAKNFSDSQSVLNAWMNSPTHKENILRSDYEDIGFAIVNGKLNGEETTLVVQMFGKKSVQTAKKEETISLIPSVTQAQAEEQNQASLTAQMIKPSPELRVATIAAKMPSLPKTNILPSANQVIKNPLFDLGQITKILTLTLSSLLMLILIIDGIFIWKRKIVRIGGRNLAHIGFLAVINSVVFFMSFGSIL